MKVDFYRTSEGTCPVEDYLDGLNAKQAQKVMWTLRAVETLSPVPANYLQKMVNTGDLWEVRISHAGNIFRLLGWMAPGGKLMLANGFTKKTQATPAREIAITEKRKHEYEKRAKK
jgi:phage-related protein